MFTYLLIIITLIIDGKICVIRKVMCYSILGFDQENIYLITEQCLVLKTDDADLKRLVI